MMQKTINNKNILRELMRQLIWLTAAGFILFSLVIYYFFDDEIFRLSGAAATVIIFSFLFAFYADEKFDMFSPAFFWGINFALFYGVAAFLPFAMPPEQGSYNFLFTIARSYYPLAILVTLFCILFFYIGYCSNWAAELGRRNTWFSGRNTTEFNARIYWGILLLMGVSSFLILILGGGFNQVTDEVQSPLFYSAAGFIQSGLFVAVPYAIARALEAGSGRFWKIASLTSVSVVLLFGLPSGSKTLALLGLIFLAFSWNYCRHRFTRPQALMAILAVLALLLLLMPYNSIYRDVLLSDISKTESGVLNNFNMMKEAVIELSDRDPEELRDLAVTYTSQRLSNISIVAVILARQHENGYFAMGDTYFRLVYMFIPRFIWPEKPPITIGREVAVKLGLGTVDSRVLGVEMSNTSIGLTFIGEPVYNFSIYIAPFIMLAMGMFYRWLYELVKAQDPGSGAFAIGIASYIWYTMIFTAHESSMAAMFAGAIKFFIFLWILQRALGFRKSA